MSIENLSKLQDELVVELDKRNFLEYVKAFEPPPPVEALVELIMGIMILYSNKPVAEIANKIESTFDDVAAEMLRSSNVRIRAASPQRN